MILFNKFNLKYAIVTLFIVLVAFGFIHMNNANKELKQEINILQQEIKKSNKNLEILMQEVQVYKPVVSEKPQPAPKAIPVKELSYDPSAAWEVIVTAYDLSVQSCGKSMDNPGYGVTASGECLAGHTWDSARAIAVDPDMIPLGSQVMIIFEDEYASQYNGVYTALDTGGDIDGNRIDLFMGDFQSYEPADEAMAFGVRSATIYLL